MIQHPKWKEFYNTIWCIPCNSTRYTIQVSGERLDGKCFYTDVIAPKDSTESHRLHLVEAAKAKLIHLYSENN